MSNRILNKNDDGLKPLVLVKKRIAWLTGSDFLVKNLLGKSINCFTYLTWLNTLS